MGAGSRRQTVGYRYALGVHMVCCQGPVDEVLALRVGDKDLPTGSTTASAKNPVPAVPLPATSSQRLHFNAPNLFGGEDREGGITGFADLEFGGPTQGVNGYLQARIGGLVPAYRGVLGLVLRGVELAANSPYIKPWAIKVRRTPAPSLSAFAQIGTNANPAHIIYECLTSTRFGLGYGVNEIDVASFQAAAQELHTEGFGLSLLLADQRDVEEFIADVLRHIDATLYADPESGKFVLALVRAGYTVSALPVFDESNIIALEQFQRPGLGELVNQVTVVYRDPDTDRQAAVTVHDIATQEAQGGTVATTITYDGIDDPELASAVATRDLRGLSTPLAKLTIETTRAGRVLRPGAVFRFSWPDLGIADLVMRVVRVSYGTRTDGRCRIEAVEDAFGLTEAVYAAPQPTGWAPPVSAPAAASIRRLFELPYWVLVQLAADNAALLGALDSASGYLGVGIVRPTSDAIDYELYTYPTGGVEQYRQTAAFCPTAVLASAVGVTATTFALASPIDTDLVLAPGWALIDDELVAVLAVDFDADTVTVARGVMDTTPVPHASAARILFLSSAFGQDPTEYAVGEEVFARVLPSTYLGRLTAGSAPVDSLVMTRRQFRPYPPGQVRINTVDAPASITGDLVVAWAHRDRVMQTAQELVTQAQGSIGPEPGTTYTLRIYNDVTNVLLRTVTGLTGTTYTYTLAQEATDNGGTATTRTRVELVAVRDTFESWQAQVRIFDRA